jgi:V/A-type H+-transporting ATPase subunit K
MDAGLIAVGAGLAIGLAGIGTGIAQQGAGAAAVGATAEDPKMFGKGIVFMALPETIVIFGLVIAFLLYTIVSGASLS